MQNDPTATVEHEVETVGEKPAPKTRRAKRATPKTSKKEPASASRAEPSPKPVRKLVVLFRHGIAEDPSPDKEDADRSLTTAGHDRTKRAARGLAKVVPKVDVIHSSPFLRALQTALWATRAWRGKVKVQTTDALRPDASPDDVRKLVAATDGKTIVLVGHEPNLTRCLADLLGMAEVRANLRKAGCVAVSVDEQGRGTLEWMLTPRTLRGL
jgi:phosphohistidine phosphatase